MELPARGDVVVTLFPESDSPRRKPRPVLVLSGRALGPAQDFLVCTITTKQSDPLAFELHPGDFLSGGLKHQSFVRPLYLYAAHLSIFGHKVGVVKDRVVQRAVQIIQDWLAIQN